MYADYSTVTETPGDEITREAASMLVTRYAHAARYCGGKDVLEIACGAGQGLGYVGADARRVIGGDYTQRLLRVACQHYGARFPLLRLDAESLPLASSAFDVVILHEAIYYLRSAKRFVDEAERVLRPGGRLIMSTVNREWGDFNPSPLSHAYPSAGDLRALLETRFARVEIYGSFSVSPASGWDAGVSLVKRLAVRFRLIPKTMRGKRFLKRIFLGKLVPVPAEITADLAPYVPPVVVPANGPCPGYKVVCAVAQREPLDPGPLLS
jgi:SAM-dependent methyltransferase